MTIDNRCYNVLAVIVYLTHILIYYIIYFNNLDMMVLWHAIILYYRYEADPPVHVRVCMCVSSNKRLCNTHSIPSSHPNTTGNRTYV